MIAGVINADITCAFAKQGGIELFRRLVCVGVNENFATVFAVDACCVVKVNIIDANFGFWITKRIAIDDFDVVWNLVDEFSWRWKMIAHVFLRGLIHELDVF